MTRKTPYPLYGRTPDGRPKLNLPRYPRIPTFPDDEDKLPRRHKVFVIEDFLWHLGFSRGDEVAIPRALALELATRVLKPIRGRKVKFQSEWELYRFWIWEIEYRREQLVTTGMSKRDAEDKAVMEIAPVAKANMNYRGKIETLENELLSGLKRGNRLPKRRRVKTPE